MIETERLILRAWEEKDRTPFAQLNADPEVMRHFPSTLTPNESDAIIAESQLRIVSDGFCFMAAELKKSGEFIGMVGLNKPRFELSFSPCVEVGWRLAKPFWRLGYATEAAGAWLSYGFNELELPEIVSFAPKTNLASVKVMQRIGMEDSHSTFTHPKIEPNHKLAEHVLYRITRRQFLGAGC